MWRIASLFLFQRLKGSMSADTYNLNDIEKRGAIKLLFLQGKTVLEIHTILKQTLREHAPSYATIKRLATQFDSGSNCNLPHPGRTKTVTIAV